MIGRLEQANRERQWVSLPEITAQGLRVDIPKRVVLPKPEVETDRETRKRMTGACGKANKRKRAPSIVRATTASSQTSGTSGSYIYDGRGDREEKDGTTRAKVGVHA